MRQRFTLGDGYSIKEFVMRELTTKDEEQAAIMADRFLQSSMKNSAIATFTREQKEAIRLSLVEVDGTPVNREAPYMEMDNWSSKTYKIVQSMFNDMNGVSTDDVKKCQATAEILDHGDKE